MLQEFARRSVAVFISVALLSACVGQTEDAGTIATTEQDLANNGGLNADGDACCAVDYRDGGKTILCGKRDGGWCCTEDNSDCAVCWYYECEPPPAPTRVKVPKVKVTATLASP
ncbi:MAG TPA: hypothetical protein VMF89_15365 [Polyangiales bacterium]|nr:hypothetical protein [Polyangiales bacterium]